MSDKTPVQLLEEQMREPEKITEETLTLLNDMLMNGTPQEKEFAARKFDEWFAENLNRAMKSSFSVP